MRSKKFCGNVVTVRLWCSRGVVAVWSWCGRGVVVAWSWYDRGGVVVLMWRWGGRKSPHPPFVDVIYYQNDTIKTMRSNKFCGSVVAVRLCCCRGVVVVWSWCGRGVVVV